MRRCTRCLVEKNEEDFHVQWRNNRNRYYPCRHCRECDKKICAEYYLKNKQKLIDRAEDWRKNNPEKFLENRRKNYQKKRHIFKARLDKSRSKNMHKVKARGMVKYNLDIGKLIRPENCENCSIVCKPHAHHSDYNKPLEVKWYCVPCHHKIHKELR